MKTSDVRDMLDAVGELNDAILKHVKITRWQTQVDLRFDVTWSIDHGADEPPTTSATITLTGVRELRIRSDLPESVWDDRLLLGWSHNEIAVARLDEPDLPKPGTGVRWISFLWESDQRRIDVAFAEAELTIRQRPARGPRCRGRGSG